MRTLCKLLGLISMLLIFVLPFAYAFESVTLELMKRVILLATLTWFITAPFWIGNKQQPNA
jgi:hypothetical protein